MSNLVELQDSRGIRELPIARPFDEEVWQAWLEKGRAEETRSSATRTRAAKWVSAAALLAAAGLGSHLAPYEVVVRFIVAVGAMVVMFQAFHMQRYTFAALFGALALLFNPVVPVFGFWSGWQRVLVVASAVPFVASLAWRKVTVPRLGLTSLLVLGVMSAATLAADLSSYRDFQLGTDLPTVAKQTGASPSQAKAIHRRPALIQELEWRPQPLGWSTETEPVEEVVFSFYDSELFRIAVKYDRHETEGLTTADIVGIISTTYGSAAKPPAVAKTVPGPYGDPEEVIAQWQNPQYRFDLIRSSYGPSFRLIGVLKRLEEPAQAAILEASRLDNQEAPQREAARMVSEEEAARTKLEKARLVNKPKFRP